MAIKKYHVSQNLWSFSDISIAVGERLKTTTIVLPSGTYTFKAKYSSDNTNAVTIGFYDENNQIHTYNMAQNNGYVQYSYTGTITAIRLYTANNYNISASYAADFTDIMLNTGSTPLPYEPYGNTWNTIPYRKYGTETDTITTLPKTIIGDGQSASAVIKGNMQQSGTPTSTNPIYPTECGDKTANLWDESYTGISSSLIYKPMYVGSGDFTLSSTIPNGENNIRNLFFLSGNVSSGASSTTNGVALGFAKTVSSVDGYVTIAYRSTASGNPNSPADYDTMLNTGSTALPYEPSGYKIPISSASITTPVYLGEVQTTRKINKYEFTGQENITLYTITTGNLFRIELPSLRIQEQFARTGICTHYRPVILSTDRVNGTISGGDAVVVQGVVDIVDDYESVDTFKAYLAQQYAAGTPVTVWYVLAEPTTGIVNEPIRKIGDYADTVSGITIPTIAGADSFDVLTTLKPSEVQLTYHRWHEHSDTVFSNP